MGKRYFALFSMLWIMVMAVSQAQGTRDYAIIGIQSEISADNSQITLIVVVENQGASASVDAEVLVKLLTDNDRVLISDILPPLEAGKSVTLQIPLEISEFPPNSRQSIEVSIGLDEFEIANTPIAENNTSSIVVAIPERVSAEAAGAIFAVEGSQIVLLGYIFEQQQLVVYASALTGALILLWLLSVILRLIFRRPPRFGAWQPPYGMMPMYDQNSLEGRRQAWQQHAQSGLLLAAPTEGNLHAVKLLLGSDGVNLRNWKVTGLRLSQYDTYGRITRSQTVANPKWVKRMNAVLRKRPGLGSEALQKMLRPVASGFVKQFRKKIGSKNIFLPVSMDIRLEGKHGDVRIIFELYQCRRNIWYRLDQWEPTMMIVSQILQENLTFTIHGKMGNEKARDFYNRLQDDIIWLLIEMMQIQQPQQQQEELPHDMFNIPDTLSGMEPIRDESEPFPGPAA